MREKRLLLRFLATRHRITPAYAGKTIYDNDDEFLNRDHPRVCGKNAVSLFNPYFTEGSPPRMREKLTARRE